MSNENNETDLLVCKKTYATYLRIITATAYVLFTEISIVKIVIL